MRNPAGCYVAAVFVLVVWALLVLMMVLTLNSWGWLY